MNSLFAKSTGRSGLSGADFVSR